MKAALVFDLARRSTHDAGIVADHAGTALLAFKPLQATLCLNSLDYVFVCLDLFEQVSDCLFP